MPNKPDYTLVYFSPTGNVAHLADLLAQYLADRDVTSFALERIDPASLPEGAHLVLLYPIHAFNAPRNIKQWVKDLHADRFDAISLIAVGSGDVWFNEAVSLDLRRVLEAKGYSIRVDVRLAMPVTMLMAVDTETGRDLVQTAQTRISEIAKVLQNNGTTDLSVSTRARVMNTLAKAESFAARAFGLELHATDTCTSCGLCWENCPMHNIREGKDSKPRFGMDCLMCLRCIYACPTQAIKPRFSVFVPIKGGYKLDDYLRDT